MKDKITKIINGVSVAIMVAAVLLLISAVMTKDGEVPEVLGYSALRVLTGSMEPEMETDSLILVKHLDDEKHLANLESEVAKDDIITFYSQESDTLGMVVTHRVIEVKGSGSDVAFVTKGDSNALADQEAVDADNIIGKVVWHSNLIGKIVRLLLNPAVFFPVVIIPLVIMILVNLRASIRTSRRIMKEEEELAIREAIARYKAEHADDVKPVADSSEDTDKIPVSAEILETVAENNDKSDVSDISHNSDET